MECRQWRHRDLRLGTCLKILLRFILTTRFARIVIKIWYTKTNFVPILLLLFSSTSLLLPLFLLLSLLLLFPWLCWCWCHYHWCWCDCRHYCCSSCGIVCFYYIIDLFFLTLIMYRHCYRCYHFTVTILLLCHLRCLFSCFYTFLVIV